MSENNKAIGCEWCKRAGYEANWEITVTPEFAANVPQPPRANPVYFMCGSCFQLFGLETGRHHLGFVSAHKLDGSEHIYATEDAYKKSGSPWAVPPDPAVDHPKHYNVGKYEVIDVIEDWRLGFNDGNVVKYVARAAHKGRHLEDLKKGRWYLDREIARLELQAQGRAVHPVGEPEPETLDGFVNRLLGELIGLTPVEFREINEGLKASKIGIELRLVGGPESNWRRSPADACNCDRNAREDKTPDGSLCEHSNSCPKAMPWQKDWSSR